MPISPADYATQFTNLLKDFNDAVITQSEFETQFATLWETAVTGGTSIALIGAQLSSVLGLWYGNQVQMSAWISGSKDTVIATPAGQPEAGYYPLTNHIGVTIWLPSLEKLIQDIAKGAGVLSGHGAPAALLGRLEDLYIDLDAWEIYGPKTESGWGAGVIAAGLQVFVDGAEAARDAAVTAKNTAVAAAATATSEADDATAQAGISLTQAGIATAQAGIATTKATEATAARDQAVTAKTDAETAEDGAVAARDAALAAQAAAEAARDAAEDISGADFVPNAARGVADGVATLGPDGKLPHSQAPALTKTDVGLGNVDNTSDADKPISDDTQAALDALDARLDGDEATIATHTTQISDLASSASDPKTIMRLMQAIAELKGNQFGTPNGISDDFTDQDGVGALTGAAVDTVGKRIISTTSSRASLVAGNSGNADGSVITSSGEFSSTYPAWAAFNGVSVGEGGQARWLANTTDSGWLRRQWTSAKRWTQYTLRAHDGTSGNSANDIKSWTLRGSNDGSTWTTVDTRTNVPAWALKEARTYVVATPGNYTYYELNITAMQTAGNRPGVVELMYEEDGASSMQWSAANGYEFPDGSTVSASSEFNSGGFFYPAYKAFDARKYDNNGPTDIGAWATATGAAFPQWLQRKWPSARTWASYTITADTSSDQLPKSWTLQGSNDGSTWTVLDTRTNVPSWAVPGQFIDQNFVIASPGAYSHYRLNVTAVNGAAGTVCAFVELQFFAPALPLDAASVAYTALSAPAKASLLAIAKASAAFVLNTDFIGEVSRDGGATWVNATLVAREALGGGYTAYEALNIDLTGSPSGMSMKWRVQGASGKSWDVSAVTFLWN